MKIGMKAFASAVAVTFATAISGAAIAQAQQQPGAQQQQMEPVTEKEIEKFAKAEKKIAAISQKWQKKIETVETQEAAEQIQQQAQAEMVAAIQQEGLTVQRYNEIYAQAQANPELAEQIRSSA